MFRSSAAEDRSLLIVGINGVVMAMSPQSGRAIWRNDLKGAGHGVVELLVTADLVVATGQGTRIHALAYRTGETLWTAEHTSSGRATFLAEGELLFVAKGGELCCFSLDGERLWHERFSGHGMGTIALGFPGNVRQADWAGTQ
jgi:outer membrane protein assembly factor BamB